MAIRFDGQVAIVTGSGRGLGAAYAHLLGSHGARVVVHDAGVAFLASPQCNVSGVILRASNGHFSVARWKRSAGIDFGAAIATPEAITGAEG